VIIIIIIIIIVNHRDETMFTCYYSVCLCVFHVFAAVRQLSLTYCCRWYHWF